jgi:plasmid stabilization system protein ParE
MPVVKLSPRAEAELIGITDYIGAASRPSRAIAVGQRIEGSLQTPAAFPTGRASPKTELGARRFLISPWLVIYRPLDDGDGIYVLRILDGRRDLSEIL